MHGRFAFFIRVNQ